MFLGISDNEEGGDVVPVGTGILQGDGRCLQGQFLAHR